MKLARLLLVLVALACSQLVLMAQEVKKDEAKGEETKPLREQTIYIPYTKLRGVFEKEGRGVFLPYDQFQELWRKARAGAIETPEPRPTVDALLTEIDNEATVEKDVVHVTASIKIELLREGWHELPLRLSDAAILSAKLDDGAQPARIVSREDGYRLLVEKKGKEPKQVILAIEYAKAFEKTPGQNSVSFAAPQAPVNRWRIRIPQSGVKVHIHPLIAATEEPAAALRVPPAPGQEDAPPGAARPADETVVLAFVGAAPTVRIDWTPKAEGASGLAALATVQAQQEIQIDEGVIRTRVLLAYDISRAELSQLQIEVPADQKVVNVFDANVRQWEVAQQDQTQQINVQLFQPARGSQNLLIELEKFREDLLNEPAQLPVVRALGVGRQQGIVVARLSPALRAEVLRRGGLLQLDVGELPPALATGKWDFSYRYASLPFDLALTLEKVQPRVQAEQLVEAFLEPEQLTLHLLAIHNVERVGIFQLSVDLPPGFEVRQVRGQAIPNGEPVAVDSTHVEGDEDRRLIVNLSRKALGRVGLFVELQRRLADPNLLSPTGTTSTLEIPLPRVSEATVERSTGKLIIYAPESLRGNPIKTEGLQSVSYQEVITALPSTRGDRFGTTRPIVAYAYSDKAPGVTMEIERRKPQINVRQLLVANIESGVVKYRAKLHFDVLYSGVKSLRIDIPQALASEIRNETATLRDQRIEPQPTDVADGYVAWRYAGETELLGPVEVVLTWQTKIKELDIGQSDDVVVPVLQPKGVDRAWGQIALAKAENLDIRAADGRTLVDGVRPIDPQTDLVGAPELKDSARAFEFHGDWKLAVTATRYELEEVKRTAIDRAVLRMVVTPGDTLSVQALYRMRSARQRLEIKFPPGFDSSKHLDRNPQINGRMVNLERGDQGEVYLPLVNQNPDDPFLLEIRYAVPSGLGRLDLPEFPEQPAIQKVYLCAYLPQEQALLGSRGPWTSEFAERWRQLLRGGRPAIVGDRELVNWVREGMNLTVDPMNDFQTPQGGNMYAFSTLRPSGAPDGSLRLAAFSQNALSAFVFLFITIPGVILVTRPLSVRFTAVGLLLVGLVGVGAFLPTFAMQIFDEKLAMAIGLVAAVWILLGLVRFSHQRLEILGARRGAGLALAPAGAGAGGALAAVAADSPFRATPSQPLSPPDTPPGDSLPTARSDDSTPRDSQGGDRHA